MSAPWARVEPLAEHDLESFRSGRAAVDDWLTTKARSSRHLVATHVCVDEISTVVGFFALTSIVVETVGLPSSVRRAPRGAATAVLLAQMGLREDLHGGGHGASLFRRAAREAAVCSTICRIPLLVVDAADEGLVGFYARFGMKRLPNSFRLVARLDKIAL